MRFPLVGATSNDPGATPKYTAPVNSFVNGLWSATENLRQIPVSEACSVVGLTVLLDTAPGGVTSRTFTVRKNGAATGATVTITGAATTASFSGAASFAAGDLMSLETTNTGSPAGSTRIYWWIDVSTTGTKSFVMGLNAGAPSVSAVNYANPHSANSWSTLALNQEAVFPTAGTLTNLAVATTDGAPGAGTSYALAAFVNEATAALSATISGAATAASTAGSQAIAAGDTISMRCTPASTPTARHLGWCVTFEPTIEGESCLLFGNNIADSNALTQFEQPLGIGTNAYSTTENLRFVKLPACDLLKFYIKATTAPGGVASRALRLRKNSADTALLVTLTGAAVTGHDTTDIVNFVAGDTLDLSDAPSTVPAATTIKSGVVMFTPQPGASTLAGTGTLASSAAVTAFAAAALAGTGTLGAAGIGVSSGAEPLAGSGTLTVAGLSISPGGAPLSGSGALVASGLQIAIAADALAGSGTLTAAGIATAFAADALIGSGTLGAAGSGVAIAEAAFEGDSNMNDAGVVVRVDGSMLDGAGDLAADGFGTRFAASILAGTGTLAAAGHGIAAGAASLAGTGTLAADGFPVELGAADLVGTGSLIADGQIPASVHLAGSGTLACAGKVLAGAACHLAGTGTLVCTPEFVPVTSGGSASGVGTGHRWIRGECRLRGRGRFRVRNCWTLRPPQAGSALAASARLSTKGRIRRAKRASCGLAGAPRFGASAVVGHRVAVGLSSAPSVLAASGVRVSVGSTPDVATARRQRQEDALVEAGLL